MWRILAPSGEGGSQQTVGYTELELRASHLGKQAVSIPEVPVCRAVSWEVGRWHHHRPVQEARRHQLGLSLQYHLAQLLDTRTK